MQDLYNKVLNYNSLKLFFFFLLMLFSWDEGDDPTPETVTTIANLIGLIVYLIWIYGIYNISKNILNNEKLSFKGIEYFDVLLLALILISGLSLYIGKEDPVREEINFENIKFYYNYSPPFELSLTGIIITTLLTWVAAKSLKSAELKKVATLKEYFITFLCISIPYLGVWFIQPKIKKLI